MAGVSALNNIYGHFRCLPHRMTGCFLCSSSHLACFLLTVFIHHNSVLCLHSNVSVCAWSFPRRPLNTNNLNLQRIAEMGENQDGKEQDEKCRISSLTIKTTKKPPACVFIILYGEGDTMSAPLILQFCIS